MVDDVRIERTGVRTKLGTTLLKEDKKTPAVIAEDFRVARPEETRKEAMGEERAYLVTDRKSRDAQTQFGALERQLRLMIKRGKNGEALTDEELEMVLKLIAELPGRREGRDELSLYVTQMILKVNEEGFEGKTDTPEDVWEEFKKGKNIEELGEEHPEMWLVYEYIEIHGKDPSQVDWREVSTYGKALAAISRGEEIPREILREIADNATYGIDAKTSDDDAQKIRDDLYQKLLAKEGYDLTNKTVKKWRNNAVKERAFSLWLGLRHEDVAVDVERYWKQRLLPVVEKRLGRMRSQAVARVKDKGKPKDKGEKEMMEITKPKDVRKEEYWKGYNSALAVEDLASKTLLGRYLDEMGKGAYWRGKAKLDHAYLSLYMGILIDHPEAAMKSGMIGIFTKMNSDQLGDHIRNYTGVNAMYEMAQDKRVVDVLNELYHLTDETYSVKLKRLGEKYEFDPKGDLPDFVTDAVMMEKVFMMDIKNMYTSDRRQQIIDPAGFYLRKAVTYGEKMDDGLYRVIEMMGNHFKFCEGILMKMGFVSAMNIKENYHAIVPDDDREFDPEKYPDQEDLIWQYMFMLALQLRDKPLRRVVEAGDEVNYKVSPGLAAEFMVYTNERWRKKKGEKERKFDHRRGVLKRFVEVLREDSGLIKERGRGKTGLDMELIEGSGVTVKQAMIKVLKDFKGKIEKKDGTAKIIDGVEIQTNGHEIFYDDKVAELLVRYEEYKKAGGVGNPEFDKNLEMLESLLNLRNVLRDHRAWGLVWSIDEPEVRARLEKLKDFEYAERYIHAGADPKKHLLELVNADPFQGLEEMALTPDAVMKTFNNMGHRLLGHLYERNMFKLMTFAEIVVLNRAGQLEIPDAQTLRKMIDPQGDIRVGTMAVSEVHGAIWNEMKELGYMDKLVQLRLMLIDEGFYKRWDDAVSAEAKRLLAAEAFTWAMTRDLPLKQEAWIYDELATYLEPGLPVESYHVPDVVVKGGENSPPEFQRTKMGIQSLNRKQIELFFTDLRREKVGKDKEDKDIFVMNEELGIRRAGDIFGGIRGAVAQIAGGGVGIKAGASEEASGVVDNKGKAVLVAGGQQVAVFQIWRRWVKVGVTQADVGWVEGWLKLDEIQLDFVDQETEGYARQGETMYQGSRFVWNAKKEKWDLKLGEWRLDRNSNKMFFYKEGSKLIVKKLEDLTDKQKKEQKESGRPYNDQGKVRGFKRELRLGEDQINPKTGETEEANFPYLVFKSEAHRKKFFDERMRMIFSLMFGRARKALRGGQAKVPLSGVLYEKKEAALSEITRGGYDVQTMMRYMERKGACRAALVKMLAEYFGIKAVSDTVLEGYMESYTLIMQARMWGEDGEAVNRFIKELSAIRLLRKDTLTKEGALSRGETIVIQLSNASLKLAMKAISLETSFLGIPINVVFGAMLAIPQVLRAAIPIIDTMVTENVFAQALKGIDIGRKLGLIGLEVVVASWVTHQIKRWLAGRVRVDVKNVNLDDIPYLDKFKAHVPVP